MEPDFAAADQPRQPGEAELLLGLAPGIYRVLHDSDVTAGSSVGSADVAELREGAAVAVLEVLRLEEDRRIRGLIDEPRGWISLASLSGRRRWAVPVLCGVYFTVRGIDVTVSERLSSEDTCSIEEGKFVHVLELVHCREDKRVRGRIDSPSGWISLLNTENGGQWAVNVEQEDAEVREVLSQEPGLFEHCSLPYSALRRALCRSHKKLNAAHKQATDAWRCPLSLFTTAAEEQARARGVPEWAIGCVRKMQRLVEAAAELQDLADVYQAQINAAESRGRGLHRNSLRIQLERLDELSLRFHASAPLLFAAREAFDAPERAPPELPAGLGDPGEVECGQAGGGREVIIEVPSKIRMQVASASRSLLHSLSTSLHAVLSSPVTGNDEESEPVCASEIQGRRLRSVTVRAGSLVSSIGFEYSDGTARASLSGWEGEDQEPFVLEEGEVLTGVRGRQGRCLEAVGFVTSRGRDSCVFGSPGGGMDFSLEATEGFQIWSIERNLAGRVVRLIEVPVPLQQEDGD